LLSRSICYFLAAFFSGQGWNMAVFAFRLEQTSRFLRKFIDDAIDVNKLVVNDLSQKILHTENNEERKEATRILEYFYNPVYLVSNLPEEVFESDAFIEFFSKHRSIKNGLENLRRNKIPDKTFIELARTIPGDFWDKNLDFNPNTVLDSPDFLKKVYNCLMFENRTKEKTEACLAIIEPRLSFKNPNSQIQEHLFDAMELKAKLGEDTNSPIVSKEDYESFRSCFEKSIIEVTTENTFWEKVEAKISEKGDEDKNKLNSLKEEWNKNSEHSLKMCNALAEKLIDNKILGDLALIGIIFDTIKEKFFENVQQKYPNLLGMMSLKDKDNNDDLHDKTLYQFRLIFKVLGFEVPYLVAFIDYEEFDNFEKYIHNEADKALEKMRTEQPLQA
ncbi:MAG: hypothetical protein K2L13_04205, partial [Opitutales bacterium]|nr:hypothetical protein [Opitutales bacterium]